MRQRIRRALMLFVLLQSPVFVGLAYAHNCSPQNPSDCERTKGYNTGLAVGGTIAAIGGALFGSSLGGNGKGDDGEKEAPGAKPGIW